jgi:hypothetical protein
MLHVTIGLILLIFSFSGCAWINQSRLADSRTEGRIENNIYTSPRRSFRIRIPWLSTIATLRDERPTPDTLLVTIKDDLCREFTVFEWPGLLGTQSLQSWVDTHIVQDLKRLGFEVRSKTLTTRNRTVISLRYRAPAAAPCTQTTEVDGKQVVTKRDADVGWYVYHRDGAFYRLIYVIGTGPGAPSLWYINREPVDDVLAQFADGFEIIDMKDHQAVE